MKSTRAIIYTRVSTDEQAKHGNSLTDQQVRLKSYCERNSIHIVAHYKEDYSAKTFKRPEFNKLLNFLRANKDKVDVLLFIRWDRFSRNTEESYKMISTLESLKVSPQAIDQPLDLSIPEQRIMLSIYLTYPEVENLRRGLNVRMGMRRTIKEGRWPRKAMFGYKNVRDESNKPIVIPDPTTAPIVQQIFEEFATGTVTQEEIRSKFRKKGYNLSKSNFSLLLRNKFYKGILILPAYEDEPEVEVKGIHEPIIPEYQFYHVQDILDGRNKSRNTPKTKRRRPELHLVGHVLCNNCGQKITGSRSKGNGGHYYYYHCNQCGKVRYRADMANESFVRLLEELEPAKEVQELFLKMLKHQLKDRTKSTSREQKKITEQITKLKTRKQSLEDAYLDGDIEQLDYASINERIKQQLLPLESQLREQSVATKSLESDLTNGMTRAFNLRNLYVKANMDDKFRIVGSIFPRKFVFEKNKVRTTEMNEVLLWIMSNSKALEGIKKGEHALNGKFSSLVAPTGIEPVSKV